MPTVRMVYDPAVISYEAAHRPSGKITIRRRGMQQGGTIAVRNTVLRFVP